MYISEVLQKEARICHARLHVQGSKPLVVRHNKVAVSVKCLDGKTIPYTIYYSDLNSQLADYPVTYTFTTLS